MFRLVTSPDFVGYRSRGDSRTLFRRWDGFYTRDSCGCCGRWYRVGNAKAILNGMESLLSRRMSTFANVFRQDDSFFVQVPNYIPHKISDRQLEHYLVLCMMRCGG